MSAGITEVGADGRSSEASGRPRFIVPYGSATKPRLILPDERVYVRHALAKAIGNEADERLGLTRITGRHSGFLQRGKYVHVNGDRIESN